MNDVDRWEAAEALMRWFESQDIMPADASSVMTTVMATCLTRKTRDLENLERAVSATRDMLVIDIAECLRYGQ